MAQFLFSTLQLTGSKQTVLNSLALTWNLSGAF